MNIDEIHSRLCQNSNSMSFNPPATESNIISFENDNLIKLPKPFRELLKLFNGGEIYSPGTKIYGIDSKEDTCFTNISKANKTTLEIPGNYYIIAKLNYGDYICLNFLPPYDVIQWDNTNKRKYLSWKSLESWLEFIIDFGYMPEEKNVVSTPNISDICSNSNTVSNKKKRKITPIFLSIIPFVVICGFIVYGKAKLSTEHEKDNSDTSHSSVNAYEYEKASVTNAIALNTSVNYSSIANDTKNSNDSFTTVADEEKGDYKYGTVNTIKDPLNVRKQPSINSDKLGSVEKGATVTIIGDKDEWYEIKYGNQIGYVSKLYVILENEPQLDVAVTGVVMTKDDPLNVRERPNANSDILGTVPKGGTVSIINDDGEWYEIKYGAGAGYVSKKYVSLT